MRFYILIAILAFSANVFTNPLPVDSVDSEPYLPDLADPEISVPTPSDPFLSENLHSLSYSSITATSLLNSQLESTVDPSEPPTSTDLVQVPCQLGQAIDGFWPDGFCRVVWPKSGPEQQPKEPKKADEPLQVPVVPNIAPQSDSENVCDPTSVFNQHYCCDGPVGVTTSYAGQICYYLIQYCIPCGSSNCPLREYFLFRGNKFHVQRRWNRTL